MVAHRLAGMSSSQMWDLDGALVAGRYRLSGVLGRGGNADVYRARDGVLERDVAVKVLRQPSTGAAERARFVAEARILAGLSHPGLVGVLDAGPDAGLGPGDGGAGENDSAPPAERSSPGSRSADPGLAAEWSRPFVVMELVEGPSLAQVISRGPVPVGQVLLVGIQVAEALAHIHARDIVHRDVKPGNILLSDRGLGDEPQIKLADFGIARLLGDTARYTQTGQTIGTAAYLSPEQVTGGSVTGATDIYALGLVLLEAITLRREFPGPPTEAALARLHRSPRIPPDLSWGALLESMTASDPSGRPTGREVANRLRTLAAADDATAGAHESTRVLPVKDTPANASASLLTNSDPSSLDSGSVTRVGSDPGADTAVAATRLLQTGADPQENAVGRPPIRSADRRRRSPVVVVIVIAVFVAALAVAGLVARQRSDSTSIPPNTPAQLREPLQRLHEAVNGK